MKNQLTQILIAVILIQLSTSVQSFSQVPDDVDGRLWRLAKVWGFAKYYHPNNCNVDWNAFALQAIDSLLVSGSNQSFNATIEYLLTKSGEIPPATEPLVHQADVNLNARFEWIDDPAFSGEVGSLIDSILKNFRPRENCLVKPNDFTNGDYAGMLSFSNDNLFNVSSFSYLKESHRILALIYYWNVINYYHAARNLMDQDWDSTLYQFIPLIREVRSDKEFHLLFLQLVTRTDDSHGFTYSPHIDNLFGSKMPLLKIEFIDNQTIVSKIGPQESVIKVGDKITKVNGINIDTYRDSIANYSPASNESSLNRDLNSYVLQGQIGTTIQFELERENGEKYITALDRNFSFSTYFNWINDESRPMYEVTTCGYGYVNMGKLTQDQIPAMYAALENTPAIIFDIRNYPKETLWSLIPYFYSEPTTWALFALPDLSYPGWYQWIDNKFDAGTFSNPKPYKGKVIILVNAETQSQAEYTAMGLQLHPNSFTIGSQTAGADGNITRIPIPGNIKTSWSSLGVYYPDTTNTQRVGIRIDSIVKKTREDIILGRDAEIIAAFDCLINSNEENASNREITLYPNPADDQVYLTIDIETQEEFIVEAFNTFGQKVLQQKISSAELNHFPIDVSGWMNGIYIVNLRNRTGYLSSEKVIVQH